MATAAKPRRATAPVVHPDVTVFHQWDDTDEADRPSGCTYVTAQVKAISEAEGLHAGDRPIVEVTISGAPDFKRRVRVSFHPPTNANASINLAPGGHPTDGSISIEIEPEDIERIYATLGRALVMADKIGLID